MIDAILDADIGIDAPCRVDVILADGLIRDVVPHGDARVTARDGAVIDAAGAALLPSLHDHHLHLYAAAAALQSLSCGPPDVADADALQAALHRRHAMLAPGEWLRGVGYHESVAGEIDRHWLDRCGPARPLRIQHRSGRLWILNSLAIAALGVCGSDDDVPLERDAQRQYTGRLYDADDWMRRRRPRQRPSLRAISRELARLGVASVTDTTPDNDADMAAVFAAAIERGELLQAVTMMGNADLDAASAFVSGRDVQRGAHKFHLHDADLPEFDTLVAAIQRSHAVGRAAAFHCVTRTDLTFALSAIEQAGAIAGDRIEHASVAPPELLDWMRRLGVAVVSQPGFIAERGDTYLTDVDADDRPWLYRLRSVVDAGIVLASSTDAPFGRRNPWQAMHAAVTRQTDRGLRIGADEALSPEQALQGFLLAPDLALPRQRRVERGAAADLCLLAEPWAAARTHLDRVVPRLTLRAGRPIAAAGDG